MKIKCHYVIFYLIFDNLNPGPWPWYMHLIDPQILLGVYISLIFLPVCQPLAM